MMAIVGLAVSAVFVILLTLLLVDVYLLYKHYGRDRDIVGITPIAKIVTNDTIHLSNSSISSSSSSSLIVTNASIPSSSSINRRKPKIAYIFAGAVRSFTCPQVHWTIKTHLIDALGGEPYVFIRLSYEDNENTQTGDGKIITRSKYNDMEINETLRLLNPVVIESFKLSTQVEEMQRYYPQPIHTVFRENDNRRYSMFFHRCRGYRLMLKYEVDHNMTFDWVILARLDAAWLDYVLPIEAYKNDRVWLTETGFSYFNDQFMLIPRQFSDYLYDLNTKVTKQVYCLGGPDVERWKCNRTELQRRGVSEEKIASVLPYCCSDHLLPDVRSSLGYSERIHFRHLRIGKIPVSLTRFPVALTRLYHLRHGSICEIECFRVYAYQYKGYLFSLNISLYPHMASSPVWPDTLGRSISARDRQLCYIMKEKFFPWQPISAYNLHSMNSSSNDSSNSSDYQLDYSKRLVDQLDRVHPSIIINPKDTEFWRIHPTWNIEGCLTYSYDKLALEWLDCIEHSVIRQNLRYEPMQLFHLHVIPERRPADEVIIGSSSISYQRSHWFPETTYGSTSSSSIHQVVPNTTRLIALQGDRDREFFRYLMKGAMCLTASALEINAVVTMKLCSDDATTRHLQNLLTVRTQMDGSHPHSTIGQLAFAAAPHLCVARDENVRRPDVRRKVPLSNSFKMLPCGQRGSLHLVQFEMELVMS